MKIQRGAAAPEREKLPGSVRLQKVNRDSDRLAQSFPCRICGHTHGNLIHLAREMMFGFGDRFDYIECAACGCVQIKEIPANLYKYYPPDYIPFHSSRMRNDNPIINLLKQHRARYSVQNKKSILGILVAHLFGLPDHHRWTKKIGVNFKDSILDVGCGTGDLLNAMRAEGFPNLTGCDPFVKEDITYNNGVRIFKKTLPEMNGQYDFIMLNHSFEHMDTPRSSLLELARLIKPNRFVLIRVPVADSLAWRRFGVDWVGLDAPRHLFLHTRKSMHLLAKQSGFKLQEVEYDSTAFQFWGSEQYRQGIPLMDARSYLKNPHKSLFSKSQIRGYKREAQLLNQRGEGDTACFYMFKV